jgi:hypothetical protein
MTCEARSFGLAVMTVRTASAFMMLLLAGLSQAVLVAGK